MKKRLLTIITPAFNEERHIGEYIRSLQEQSYANWELLIFDDGSTDGTYQVVVRAEMDDDRIFCLKGEHKGSPGYWRNVGAKQAAGGILLFLDADMVLPRNFLLQLVRPILRGKALATCHSEEHGWNNSLLGDLFYKKIRSAAVVGSYTGVARAITRKAFLDGGGFNPALGYFDDHSPVDALVVDAFCWHHNPETIREITHHLWWVLKSKIKNLRVGMIP